MIEFYILKISMNIKEYFFESTFIQIIDYLDIYIEKLEGVMPSFFVHFSFMPLKTI